MWKGYIQSATSKYFILPDDLYRLSNKILLITAVLDLGFTTRMSAKCQLVLLRYHERQHLLCAARLREAACTKKTSV